MNAALDRCDLILSRLKGLADFAGEHTILGLSAKLLGQAQDTVMCLRIVSANIQRHAVEELRQFESFSRWLRLEIDRIVSDASSSPTEDTDKEVPVALGDVLQYVQSVMTESHLNLYLDDGPDHPSQEHSRGYAPLYELLQEQLKKHEDQDSSADIILPKVSYLYQILLLHLKSVFAGIANAQKQNVFFGEPVLLGSAAKDAPLDMRTCVHHVRSTIGR